MEKLFELTGKDLLILCGLMLLFMTIVHVVFKLLFSSRIIYKRFERSYLDVYERKMRNRLISDFVGRKDIYDYLGKDSLLILMDAIDIYAGQKVKPVSDIVTDLMRHNCNFDGKYSMSDVEFTFHKILWLKFTEQLLEEQKVYDS